MPIEYMFCFICSKQCIKIILLLKKSGLLSSLFKKIFLITLRLLFKKWMGYLNPSHFIFLFATVFNGNEPECQLIAKLTLPHRKIIRVITPFSGLQNLFWFQYKEHKVCLTKIPTHGIFKLLSVIFFKLCAL